MNLIVIILTAIGVATAFQVSIWNTRLFSYKRFFECPALFVQFKWAPFLYWSVPIVFFILTIAVYRFHVVVLLLYLLSILAGRFKTKREYIADMTKYIMEKENLSFAEAREQAKWAEKSARWDL